jgi:hypothetical protein
MPWTCRRCGYENDDDDLKWCANCGAQTHVYNPHWEMPPSYRSQSAHHRPLSGLGPSSYTRRKLKTVPIGGPSDPYGQFDQDGRYVPHFGRDGAASSSAASYHEEENEAHAQRYYPIFHPHLLNRVFLPPSSRVCDRCHKIIMDSSSWKCANGCDVDLCNACDAEAIQAGPAAHDAAAAAPAASAAAAAANQQVNQDPDLEAALAASRITEQNNARRRAARAAANAANAEALAAVMEASRANAAAAAAAAASNQPGTPENNAARRRANRKTRARSAANRLAAAARAAAAERNNAGQPGVNVNTEALRGAIPRRYGEYDGSAAVSHPPSAENAAIAAAERAAVRAERQRAAREAAARSAEATTAPKSAARVAEFHRQQAEEQSQVSPDALQMAANYEQVKSSADNLDAMRRFLNRYDPDGNWNHLFEVDRRGNLLHKSELKGALAKHLHPDKYKSVSTAAYAKYTELSKHALDFRRTIRGGTRCRARHAKNKSGRKRRTHRR